MSDAPAGDDPNRCDFCRLPCPEDSVTLERESTVYEFCSNSCRNAMLENDHVFTKYHGFRYIETGISGLDTFLPEGFPRNSFVLLSSDEGSRDRSVLAELVWRTLRRGEPAVVVTFTEPPVSAIEQFVSLDWNVLPYLESGQLHVLDCFTYRMDRRDRERMFDRMDPWNRYVHGITTEVTETVRDPSDISEIQHKLDDCLETLEMSDCGVVTVDSLTEFNTLVQPIRAYNFVKDLRADVCKGRFVPVFAGATRTGDDAFPHDLGYAVDGIVDMELNETIVKDTLLKRIRIRKMNGVLTIPEWTSYEVTSGKGLVTFDPLEVMEANREAEDGEEPPEGSADERDESAGRTAESAEGEPTEGLRAASDELPAGKRSDASSRDDETTGDEETDDTTASGDADLPTGSEHVGESPDSGGSP